MPFHALLHGSNGIVRGKKGPSQTKLTCKQLLPELTNTTESDFFHISQFSLPKAQRTIRTIKNPFEKFLNRTQSQGYTSVSHQEFQLGLMQ